MDNLVNTYCRFCAEPKNVDKLLNLDKDKTHFEKTVEMLTFVNAIYVNVSDPDILPKTVCFICYDSLIKAYEFLNKVKKAQDVLSSLFVSNENDKSQESSDDDRCLFDDLFTSELTRNENIKEELYRNEKCKRTSNENVFNTEIEVKKEPKEELVDSSQILEALSSLKDNPSNENSAQTLNVQDILDAAMCTGSFTSNLTIYAKELSDISKKEELTWKDYPWVCAYCNIEFLDVITLRSHSKLVHDKCSAFICIDCKSFEMANDFNLFISHVKKHRKHLRKYCHYCDALLEENESLNSHIKQHFKKSEVSCQSCGEILRNEDSLQKHIRQYNTVKTKRKPRRKRGTPITVEDLTCKLCQKVYKNLNSLRDHMKLHTSDRKRNYTCDRCGKNFFNKGTLTSHIMSHDKIRPHICKICNKSFLFPNMLRRHVQMHSGVKPFSCEQCGRCFRLQYQLNAHKIIHTDSMPHICQYCNKAFRFKQILKNHERQHTGAKPYSCQQCGMEFTNWSNYNKHMKRRHATDTSKKKITPDGVFPINPETGQIIQVEDPVGTEEWKSKIMIPCKRGKKKIVKEESNTS